MYSRIWRGLLEDWDILDSENFKKDTDGNTVLEMNVPGFNKDNITVEVEDNIMTIYGKNEREVEINRRYRLSESVTEVKATVKDGILAITIIEEKTSKKVKVEVS